MAIGFARIEFVKRSSGKNACSKAAYNSRAKIQFEGNDQSPGKTYDWSEKNSSTYHNVLIPAHVSEKFKDAQYLWNAVEAWETKKNAQLAMELVIALPDDKGISLEDRIQLTTTFIQKHFIENGLAAQIDIHSPEDRVIITQDDAENGLKKGMTGQVSSKTKDSISLELDEGTSITFNPKEFTGFIEKEHNWHAHVLITTRRFKPDGLEFEDHKARDIMPRINKGRVVSGPDWGKLWVEHQNRYFEELGISLRVDPKGLVPQEHLGPVRMRARAFSLWDDHQRRLEANLQQASDPEKVLEAITHEKSIFTQEDFEHFISRHSPSDCLESLRKDFWSQPQVVPLVDKQTGELLHKFTSKQVLEEERQILRLADRIHLKTSLASENSLPNSHSNLNEEQRRAFHKIVNGKRLELIQGYAGTGKSHLLKALQDHFEEEGYRIRAFGPDSATTDVLLKKGLSHTENVYRFLFGLHHGKRNVSKGKELWILDEAGKLGNLPLLEFLREAEKNNVQIVLSGDAAQLPPVERGGMFKTLCDRYGSQELENIQRQKNAKSREISKHLATGEFGSAIDKLVDGKTIRWSANKKEAMEELVLRWSQDSRISPKDSFLIIAHSNSEVRVLNEMVRMIRKQRGELGDKEYECSTHQGKIFLSTGDQIEFRRNDKTLGITNGLTGTLVEADPNRFVVSVRSGQKKQTIVFDPREYNSFQLGYAGTYYRAQGRTIDRAYVLHNKMLNKEMFYVGLTRHVREVFYFVSKDEAHSLADLKRLVMRSSVKPLSVDYTTQEALNAEKADLSHMSRIQSLKDSSFLMDQVKGHAIGAWDSIVLKASEIKEKVQDRVPNTEFYHPVLAEQAIPETPVREVIDVPEPTNEASSDEMLSQKIEEWKELESISGERTQTEWDKPQKLLDRFPLEKQAFVKEYIVQSDKASALKMIVESEGDISSKDLRLSPYFSQWQKSCGSRNQAAYEILQQIPPDNFREVFGAKRATILQEQASRHENLLLKRDPSRRVDLEEHLRENLEVLLHRLFPEGPTARDRTSFRFRHKGSLSVIHSGKKMGQFYDFENQSGGGLLKLVQLELGLGKRESRSWTQEFLGIAPDISIPKSFFRPQSGVKKEDDWVSIQPDHKNPAPKLEEIKEGKLGLYFSEVARHPYRNEKGELLFYVLRLQDKKDPTKKSTPPLSYGYWKTHPEERKWELKGYHAEKSPLYNQHLLKDNPAATVLVVEGEKTADLATHKFPGESFVCVTWLGGCGSVKKADWSPLSGRKVIIWPDNDRPGYDAANNAGHELRKIGVKSLKIVSEEELRKHFPEKWDLADDLPKDISEQLPKKLIASSTEKAVNPKKIVHRLNLDPNDPVQVSRANAVLWRVDERLRPTLETEYGVKSPKIEEQIFKEASSIILAESDRKSLLKDQFGVDGLMADRMSYQISILEAQQGRKLKIGEIYALKEMFQERGFIQISKEVGDVVTHLVTDRALEAPCYRAIHGFPLKHQPPILSDSLTQEENSRLQNSIKIENGLSREDQIPFERETGKL